MLKHVDQVFSLSTPVSPEHVLLDLMKKLLQHRDKVFGMPVKPSTKIFQAMVHNMKFVMPSLEELQTIDTNPNACPADPACHSAGAETTDLQSQPDVDQGTVMPHRASRVADVGCGDSKPLDPQMHSDETVEGVTITTPVASETVSSCPLGPSTSVPAVAVGAISGVPEVSQVNHEHLPSAGRLDGLCPPVPTPGILATPGDRNASEDPAGRETPTLSAGFQVGSVIDVEVPAHCTAPLPPFVVAGPVDMQARKDAVPTEHFHTTPSQAREANQAAVKPAHIHSNAGPITVPSTPVMTLGMLATPSDHNASLRSQFATGNGLDFPDSRASARFQRASFSSCSTQPRSAGRFWIALST